MIEKAFVKLFQGKIQHNSGVLPVIIRYKPLDRTPCITITKASETQIGRKHLFEPYEKTQYRLNNTIWLDIWCDNEQERHNIIEQIYNILYQAINNHYLQCKHYEEGTCKNTNTPCTISTLDDSTVFKSQCLTPESSGYVSFFRENNILKWTFRITGEQRLDEPNLNPPVLRTQITIEFDRMKYHNVGGHLAEKIEVNL
ncbi:MAG: hypothetical protein HUJ74_04240 [Lachnospiraceae bacterium]|nr:hypothetical protein [Lachnospiraceae bacterium]